MFLTQTPFQICSPASMIIQSLAWVSNRVHICWVLKSLLEVSSARMDQKGRQSEDERWLQGSYGINTGSPQQPCFPTIKPTYHDSNGLCWLNWHIDVGLYSLFLWYVIFSTISIVLSEIWFEVAFYPLLIQTAWWRCTICSSIYEYTNENTQDTGKDDMSDSNARG